jgi:O-antigen/teichoic acid export membrane protein
MNLVIDRSRESQPSDRLPVLTTLMLQIGLSLAMIVAAVVALPWLIPLVYGPAFRASVGPSTLLFASILFLAPASLCWMTYNAKGRPHFTSVILTAGGILSPVLTYALVSQGYGLYGASTAGLVSAGLTFGLSIFFLLRLQGYRAPDYREALVRARLMLKTGASQARATLVGRPNQRRI